MTHFDQDSDNIKEQVELLTEIQKKAYLAGFKAGYQEKTEKIEAERKKEEDYRRALDLEEEDHRQRFNPNPNDFNENN